MKESKVVNESTVEAATETSTETVTEATPEAATENVTEVREERLDRQPSAMELVKRHVLYAAAVGLAPIPLINAAGVAVVSFKLVRDLATLYDVPFQRDRVKSIVSALVGGIVSTEAGVSSIGIVKGLPLLGGALCFAAVPAFAGAATYAIGKVFIKHFESGGTFLDLDPAKVKSYFSEQFCKGKQVASDPNIGEPAKAAT
jgi:uncharacterized protein (DUF697 family)